MTRILALALTLTIVLLTANQVHAQGQADQNQSGAQPPTSATTLDEMRSNPPLRGTPMVIIARNGAEVSGMFVKVDDDTLDIVDVSGGLYQILIASVTSILLPDTSRLTTEERRLLATLRPENGRLRELIGLRRVYVWANNEEVRQVIVSELNQYGAFEIIDSFRGAEFVLYFVGRSELTDPPYSRPQLFGRLYAYTVSDAKRLRVFWERNQEFDTREPIPTRTAYLASSSRAATDLTRAFIREHRRGAITNR